MVFAITLTDILIIILIALVCFIEAADVIQSVFHYIKGWVKKVWSKVRRI